MRSWPALLCLATAIAVAVLFGAAHSLTLPVPAIIGPPPADLAAETVIIATPGGERVAGWFADPKRKRAAVLILHGVHGNRREVVERQRLFHAAGYATLAIDQQAHGESSGDRITFGHRESASAAAAIVWLRDKLTGYKIAAVGLSLGGAALLLGPEPAKADAVVLEAVYADIRNATADRLEMWPGPWTRPLTPLVVWPAAILLRLWPADLRPIDRIARLKAPVLIIGGLLDRHTPIADTRALFAAALEPKDLWEIAEAGHSDFERFAPDAWRTRVLRFLQQHLGA